MSSNVNNILFRADSSSTIGTGHIMRDLVLAKQYPEANITFATQDLNGNINHKIIEAGHKLEILKSNSLDDLDELIKKLYIDMIVIDHYGIDYNFEEQLKIKNPTLKIMVLDDTYEKHHCDILLNHNISGDEKKYKNLVPKHCELRCGAKYTLLREEFYEVKKQKTIFLAMGGADHSNLNIKILRVLEDFKNIQVIVVTTNANQNLDELKEYVDGKKNITLKINSENIAQLMNQSDFAIISPSVTANEVYFMNLPFIAIKTADNQNDMYEYLKRKEYLILERFNIKNLKINIKKMIQKLG